MKNLNRDAVVVALVVLAFMSNLSIVSSTSPSIGFVAPVSFRNPTFSAGNRMTLEGNRDFSLQSTNIPDVQTALDDEIFQIPLEGLPSNSVFANRPKPDVNTNKNTTLPIAMMVLKSENFPTVSKALRTIRKRQMWFSPTGGDEDWKRAKADTRVFPGDWIARREPDYSTKYSYQGLTYMKPKVSVPVVYQDDHMAIVNKPSGMISYSHSKGGYNSNSILRVLPHILTPPPSFDNAFRWPVSVHRLDSATSGLLVIAKTKPASVDLSKQFATRQAKKVYTAILNGIPTYEDSVIDYPIDGKPAVTEWEELSRFRCPNAVNLTCTIVEFRPRHGRTHQLRKHAAEVLGCPIVGDELYGPAKMLQKGKIFLCANGITLEHPVLNRDDIPISEKQDALEKNPKFLSEAEDGTILLRAMIKVPKKWLTFKKGEEKKLKNFEKWMVKEGAACLMDIHNMIESKREEEL
mmetsp:Transcript_7955/g.12163  ORF Transcript_7955/g.12163 Transcript_7955/m.12163 type:complete len:463 (+) Transcript_7955:474-1862(+)|eukprot:CAMPEP_0195307414 /NCGR_PEP_ID=MMETSP0707-20130614/37700_1 /TAXON_ID=33640 /ORGANISM="Asterionellopsis glacialis, Strain CCMP134" /LENGTH=462 /DNA_ID=CAMNT_0040371665 /DNA_START=484 /DNA_END=1872 /DNA_ORIENTATION=+